jgi:hemerythrin-like metal-binding protein
MRKVKKWDQGLNVGIGILDNQHKIIFDLINDLGAATEAMADRRVIDTLLDVIENYVFRHFEAEEELFGKHKSAQDHSLKHYELIKEFRKVRLSFRNRKNSENNTSIFLEQWFLAHIKDQDLPLFTSIANGSEGKIGEKIIDEYPFEKKERRRHKRIKQKIITDNDIAAYCYNTSSLKNNNAIIVDISLGGLRIRSTEPYKSGDLLVISCKIGKSFMLKEKARIVNAADNFYGAEFINLSPATEKFLVELYGAVNIRNF